MRVAVDVDGVLADRIGSIVDRVATEFGVTLSPSDIDEWDFSIPGTNTDILTVIEDSTRDPDHILSLDPLPGALEATSHLAETHELLIATHRPERIYDLTEQWLATHEIPYDRFLTTCGPNKREIPADVLIDDRPANVHAFADERGWAILFEQPWNEGRVDDDDVRIATDWDDVLRQLQRGPL